MLEIIQIVNDALEVTPEKVAPQRSFIPCLNDVGATKTLGEVTPIIFNHCVSIDTWIRRCWIVLNIAICEAVREVLINNGVLHPIGRREIGQVNIDLEAVVRGG